MKKQRKRYKNHTLQLLLDQWHDVKYPFLIAFFFFSVIGLNLAFNPMFDYL